MGGSAKLTNTILDTPNWNEVERSLIEAAFNGGYAAERIVSILAEEDFADPGNRAIFNALLDVRVAGVPVRPGTVGEALSRRGREGGRGTRAGLMGCRNAR